MDAEVQSRVVLVRGEAWKTTEEDVDGEKEKMTLRWKSSHLYTPLPLAWCSTRASTIPHQLQLTLPQHSHTSPLMIRGLPCHCGEILSIPVRDPAAQFRFMDLSPECSTHTVRPSFMCWPALPQLGTHAVIDFPTRTRFKHRNPSRDLRQRRASSDPRALWS